MGFVAGDRMSGGLYRTGMGKVGWPPPLPRFHYPHGQQPVTLFSVSLMGCAPASLTPIPQFPSEDSNLKRKDLAFRGQRPQPNQYVAMWRPVVDAFRTFCHQPGLEGKVLTFAPFRTR